jgi:hypothetical protein
VLSPKDTNKNEPDCAAASQITIHETSLIQRFRSGGSRGPNSGKRAAIAPAKGLAQTAINLAPTK